MVNSEVDKKKRVAGGSGGIASNGLNNTTNNGITATTPQAPQALQTNQTPSVTPAPQGIGAPTAPAAPTQSLLTNTGISTIPAPTVSDSERRAQSLDVLRQGGIKQLSGENARTLNAPIDPSNNIYARRSAQLDNAIENTMLAPQLHRGVLRDLLGARAELDSNRISEQGLQNTTQKSLADISKQDASLAIDQGRLELDKQVRLGQLGLDQERFKTDSTLKAQQDESRGIQTGLRAILSAKEKGMDLDPSQALGVLKSSSPGVKLGDSHLRAILPEDEYSAISQLGAADFLNYAVPKFGKDAAYELLQSKYGKNQ